LCKKGDVEIFERFQIADFRLQIEIEDWRIERASVVLITSPNKSRNQGLIAVTVFQRKMMKLLKFLELTIQNVSLNLKIFQFQSAI